MNSTEGTSATAVGGSALSEGLGAVSEARYLASDMMPPGGGPRFRIGVEGRHIIDEDFIFDAMLKVDGDFDDTQRAAYAQWICDALNEADKTLARERRAHNVELTGHGGASRVGPVE